MKPIVCFIFFCSFCFYVLGQDKLTTPELQDNLNRLGAPGNALVRTFDNAYQGVKGTPYLFSRWCKGVIILVDNQVVETKYLNYNAYSDEVVVTGKNTSEILVVRNQLVKGFEIVDSATNRKQIFSKVLYQVPHSKERKVRFMEVLWEGRNGLYLDHAKVFVKADYKDPYSANRPYDEFKDETSYFLRKGMNEAVHFKPGKKEFLRIFPEQQQLLDSLFKEKPNLKNRVQLVTIMEMLEK